MQHFSQKNCFLQYPENFDVVLLGIKNKFKSNKTSSINFDLPYYKYKKHLLCLESLLVLANQSKSHFKLD